MLDTGVCVPLQVKFAFFKCNHNLTKCFNCLTLTSVPPNLGSTQCKNLKPQHWHSMCFWGRHTKLVSKHLHRHTHTDGRHGATVALYYSKLWLCPLGEVKYSLSTNSGSDLLTSKSLTSSVVLSWAGSMEWLYQGFFAVKCDVTRHWIDKSCVTKQKKDVEKWLNVLYQNTKTMRLKKSNCSMELRGNAEWADNPPRVCYYSDTCYIRHCSLIHH